MPFAESPWAGAARRVGAAQSPAVAPDLAEQPAGRAFFDRDVIIVYEHPEWAPEMIRRGRRAGVAALALAAAYETSAQQFAVLDNARDDFAASVTVLAQQLQAVGYYLDRGVAKFGEAAPAMRRLSRQSYK